MENLEPRHMLAADEAISVGRTPASWTTGGVSNNQLKITYSVYNQQAEAVSGVLLTTTLEPDVTFVNASILPDRSGQQLAWSMGTIAPFSRASVEVTVAFAGAVPLQMDDGVKAFGTVNAGMVTDDAPPLLLRAGTIDPSLLAATADANANDRFVQAKAAQLDYDANQIFAYLTDDVGYESYRGSLRGARGTMWSSAGNSLDEASLGVALMRASGIPAQYAHGSLSDALAQELIVSMFPESFQTLGYLPPGTEVADPANDPQLLAETWDHYWFQFDAGGGFQDADTAFASATVGQTFTTPFESFPEVADTLRHKVVVKLDVESWSQSAAAFGFGGGLSGTTVLDETFNAVDLVGRPITVAYLVSESGIPHPVISSQTIVYSPMVILAGDDLDPSHDPLIRGDDFQEVFTNYPLGSQFVTGLFLKITTHSPDGTDQHYERILADRIGQAARLNGSQVSVDPNAPSLLSPLDTWTIDFQSSRTSAQALGATRAQMEALQTAFINFAAQARQLSGAAENELIGKQAVGLLRDSIISMARLRLGQFAEMADIGAAKLSDQLKLRAYLDSPRISIFSSKLTSVSNDLSELHLGIDLRKTDLRAVVMPGNSTVAKLTFQTMRGFLETALEAAALGDPPDLGANSPLRFGTSVSAQTIFEAAQVQGIPFLTLGPNEIGSIDQLTLPAGVKALITAALADGQFVMVPLNPVMIDGQGRSAWYKINPNTGETIGVLDDGSHGGGLISQKVVYQLVTIQQKATAFGRGVITGLTTTSLAKVAFFMLGMSLALSINYQTASAAFIALQVKNAYKLAEKFIKAELQTLLNRYTPYSLFGIGLRFGILLGLAVSTDPERPEVLIDPDTGVPKPPENQAEHDTTVAANRSTGAVQGTADVPNIAVAGILTADWNSSAASLQALTINSNGATVTMAGQSVGAGAVTLSVTDSVSAAVAGNNMSLHVTGDGRLSFYGPAESNLGVSGDWESYTATTSAATGITITLTTDQLMLNGVKLPMGTYTITTQSAVLTGNGRTSSPNFAGGVAIGVSNGTVELGPGSGNLAVGGTPLDHDSGATLTGYSGTINVSANANGTDHVTLAGTAANILQVVPNSPALSTDQNTPATFQAGVKTSFADAYTLTVLAPKGWTVTIDDLGNVTVTPKPGLQGGTHPVQVVARSKANPTLVAQNTVDVTVTPTVPGVTLTVVRDLVFSVPYNGVLVPSAFRATIRNLGPLPDTFNLSFANLPAGFALLHTDTATNVPAGETGILGLYFHPIGASLPPPGTMVSFDVIATSAANPAVTSTVTVEFTIPEIHAVTLSSNPPELNTTPGTAVHATLTLKSVGNVPETVDLAAVLPSGVTVDGLGVVTLGVGETKTVSITVTPDASTPLNSTLVATINASYGSPAVLLTDPLQIRLRVTVPGADAIAQASVAADQLGNRELANRLRELMIALTNLVPDPTSPVFKSQALAALDKVIVGLGADPHFGDLVDVLKLRRNAIAAADTEQEVRTAIVDLGGVLGTLGDRISDLAKHRFELSLVSNTAIAQPLAPSTFQLIIHNTGTRTTTFEFSFDNLPANYQGNFSQSSITLAPGESTPALGVTDVFAMLSPQATSQLVALGFTIRVMAQGAPYVTQTTTGSLIPRSEFASVVSVKSDPPFTNAGTTVNISARVLNAVNRPQTAKATFEVRDPSNTLIHTSAPVDVALTLQTSLVTVALGAFNTTGIAPGNYAIHVALTDALGIPIPGGTGEGNLLIGSPVTASHAATPSSAPPGLATVTNSLNISTDATLAPPFSLVGQVATTPVSSTIVVRGTVAYVAGSNGVDIVDVSNPAAPSPIDTFAENLIVQGGYTVVRELPGNRLVIASTTNFNANGTRMLVYSVADPLNPALLSDTVIPQAFMSDFLISGSKGILTTVGVFLFGNNDIGDAHDQFGDVAIVDFDAPGGPVITDRLEGTRSPPFTGIHAMTGGAIVNSTIAYVTSTTLAGNNFLNGTGQLLVVNYADPNNLVLTNTLQVPGTVTLSHVGIEGNLALVVGSNRGNQGFYNNVDGDPSNDSGNLGNLTFTTLDISDPNNPVVVSTIVTSAVFPRGTQPNSKLSIVPVGGGKFAVSIGIVDGDPVLFLVDASNPQEIVASALEVNSVVSEMTIVGGQLYTTSADGLLIYDIGNVETIPVTASVKVPKGTGVTIVAGSYNIPPTQIVSGPTFDTLIWERELGFGLNSQTITWQSTLTDLQPGDTREVTLGGSVDFTVSGIPGTVVLPTTEVAVEQILSLFPETNAVRPGERAFYTLSLSNPTNNFVSYNLSVSGVPSEWVEASPTVDLGPNSTGSILLSLTSEALAALGDYGFVVIATTASGTKAVVEGELTLEGEPVLPDLKAHGVVVSVNPTERTVGRGTSTSYVIRVTNTGSQAETFHLSVIDLPSGTIPQFSENIIDVSPGAGNYRDITLTLTVPTFTANGDYHFTVTAFASDGNSFTSSDAFGTLHVVSSGVSVEFVPTSVTPGSTYQLKVTNIGQTSETFDLSLGGAAAIVATLGATSVSLAPGASQLVPVTVNQADFALPGSLNLLATAVVHSDTAVRDSAHATVNIVGRLGMTAAFDDSSSQLNQPGVASFVLNVKNTGNLEDSYVAEIIGKTGAVVASLIGLNGLPAQSIPVFYLPGLASGAIQLSVNLTALVASTVTVRVRSLTDNTIVAQATANIIVPIPDDIGDVIVLGSVGGNDVRTRVKVIDPTNDAIISTFTPYGNSFHGGVRVSTADLDKDGILEIITAPGPGAGRTPLVKVFDYRGNELLQYRINAYESSFAGGVYVAVGDVDGDGYFDIITTPSGERAAEVRVWRNRLNKGDRYENDVFASTSYRSFLAFGSTFLGGATVAADDLNGDNKAEIVVGNGPGMTPRVRTFDLTKFKQTSTSKLGTYSLEIRPFESTDRGGVFVAAGNIRGSVSQIIIGNGVNGRGEVEIYRTNGTLQKEFVPYPNGDLNAPVHVSRKNYDGGRLFEILTAQGAPGSSKSWRVWEYDADLVDEALENDLDFKNGFFVA